MYKLPIPAADSSEAFDAAVATIRNSENRLLFERAASTVRLRCQSFDQLAAAQRFNSARRRNFSVSGLSNDAMSKLYDRQFTRGSRTEAIRNNIRNSAINDLCPYCGEGVVAELDHYLPKAGFAATTVHPPNLVPVCRDCNFAKLAYEPSPAKPAVLHPYFDTAFDTRWLYASIEEDEPNSPVVVFSISLAQNDSQLEARLRAHMQVFNLYTRFGIKAAQSLNNFQTLLSTDNGQSMTFDEARSYLRSIATLQSGGRINSWEGSALEAMSASDWYLSSFLGLL